MNFNECIGMSCIEQIKYLKKLRIITSHEILKLEKELEVITKEIISLRKEYNKKNGCIMDYIEMSNECEKCFFDRKGQIACITLINNGECRIIESLMNDME